MTKDIERKSRSCRCFLQTTDRPTLHESNGTYPHEARCTTNRPKMCRFVAQHLPAHSLRRVVEFGCGTGTYSRLLLRSFRPEHLLLNDLCEEMRHSAEIS